MKSCGSTSLLFRASASRPLFSHRKHLHYLVPKVVESPSPRDYRIAVSGTDARYRRPRISLPEVLALTSLHLTGFGITRVLVTCRYKNSAANSVRPLPRLRGREQTEFVARVERRHATWRNALRLLRPTAAPWPRADRVAQWSMSAARIPSARSICVSRRSSSIGGGQTELRMRISPPCRELWKARQANCYSPPTPACSIRSSSRWDSMSNRDASSRTPTQGPATAIFT